MMKFDLASSRRHFRHLSSTSGEGEGDETLISGSVISVGSPTVWDGESSLRSKCSRLELRDWPSTSTSSSSSSRKVMSAISGARFPLRASMTFRELIQRR